MRYGPVFLFIVSMSKQVIGSAQLFAVTKFDYFPTPWPIPRRLSAYVRVRTIFLFDNANHSHLHSISNLQ